MRKSISATALAGFAVLALSLSAQAQDKAITTSNPDTLKVSVSGSVALDWVWHDEMSNFARGTNPVGFDGAAEPARNKQRRVASPKIAASLTRETVGPT